MANLTILGALSNAAAGKKALHTISDWRGGWRRIQEPFSGAWQQNIEETHGTLLCYPTLYACIMRIATDVGTLPFQLKIRERESGVWKDAYIEPVSVVLRRPNHFQTAQQFREAWILSKLIHGNAYILKQRDAKGIVTALYVLDPCAVLPMVSDTGDVFYQVSYSRSENLLPEEYSEKQIVAPAREIIHDRCVTLHHQLIGVPPICAAHWPTVKNLKILKSSAEFFGNRAQPGGILTAPAGMTEDDATELKAYWAQNYAGANAGKVAVIGADMKFTSFAMNGADSQLVEQMRYSDEQICQPFGVPPFIIGIGTIPAGLKVDDMANMYYKFALQSIIESMEYLLDDGLSVAFPYGIELDLEPLLRMDVGKLADVEAKLVGGKIKTPDEARRKFNLTPTGGGGTLWGQNQDYPLGMLADRAEWDPSMVKPIAPDATDTPDDGAVEAVAADGGIQQEALNGAQIASLQEIVLAVMAGTIPPETARHLISVAFPLISDEDIDSMLAPIIAYLEANPTGGNEPIPAEDAKAAVGLLTADALRKCQEDLDRAHAEIWQRKALDATREAINA
jgi:HK97 family phage portal protein